MPFLGAFMAAFAVSIDAFVGSLAYGMDKINIRLLSSIIINLICTSCLFFSFLLGSALKHYISVNMTIIVSFIILFIIGLIKLLDWYIKKLIRKWIEKDKEISFSLLSFKFILSLYANPEKADVNNSRDICIKEAIPLGIAVGIDGMAVGFAASLSDINAYALLFFSILLHAIAIHLGFFLGKKAAYKTNWDINWLGGTILIILALTRLI